MYVLNISLDVNIDNVYDFSILYRTLSFNQAIKINVPALVMELTKRDFFTRVVFQNSGSIENIYYLMESLVYATAKEKLLHV